MNFLQMFQKFHEMSGAAGVIPTTTVSQVGEKLRLRNILITAANDIDLMWQNWNYLWDNTFTYDTVAGTQTYTAPVTLGRWDNKTFRIDGDIIQCVEYVNVRTEYFSTAVADRGTPDRVIIRPDKSLQFDPVPDGPYTLTVDQWLKPTLLGSTNTVADDTEQPAMPSEFRNAIVGKALILYGTYENADDAVKLGMELWDTFYSRLEASELPNVFGSNANFSGNEIEVIAQ